MFRKPMKMRDLEVWGVPSYIVDIWEKGYSPYLLAVQEKAVREYGVLDYHGSDEIAALSSFARNDRERMDSRFRGNDRKGGGNDRNRNLLAVAPTSSGKTFIGEMAAVTQAVHNKKTIYLVPLRSLAEEKYRHFKDLYASCDVNTLISSRDRREYDKRIIRGDYQVAVMVYEKFNYFLLEYPDFLQEVSLVIIDEMQMINDPVRGPLLEEIITYIKKNKPELKIIGLSAYLDNEAGFLNWISADSLLSYQRPVELRKGFVREGTFKYITHNSYSCGEETFFAPDEVRDNCYEDYLEKTVSYFMKENEPTLLFFPTRKDTRKWAAWLAGQIDAPRAEEAIAELSRLEETRSRNELLYLLEKGMAYHNADLSWEERNVVENYLRTGEIKLICATTTLAMGVNLPFKNVILTTSKYTSADGNYGNGYLTSMSRIDMENMGGRAGRLNQKEGEDFGRVIFLAHSLISETVVQNLYFNALKPAEAEGRRPRVNDSGEKYNSSPAAPAGQDAKAPRRPLKEEKNFTNFLLKAIARGINTEEKLDNRFKGSTSDFKKDDHYWEFNFEEDDLETEIKKSLKILIEHNLIKYGKKDKDAKKLSLTGAGVLINSRRIDMDTYLLFKEYLENKRGKLTNLEIITLLVKSVAGKNIPIPFPQFNQITDRYNKGGWKFYYQNKMAELVSDRGEDGKEIYQDILETDGEARGFDLETEDYLSIKKALLLYDWIGDKEIKEIEEAYKIYGGAIRKLGEGFSWLADTLGGVAESLGWSKKENKKEGLAGIKVVSERLAWGVEEEGLVLARLHIPGLGRSYVKALLREGYDNRKCLEELGEEELAKVVPKKLAGRIKKRFPLILSSSPTKNYKPKINNLPPETRTPKPAIVLEIDQHRPDRIIFEGEEIEVTARGFSLLYLLYQHKKEVVSYNNILDEVWKDDEDATYTRITHHIYKFRKDILDAIGNNKTNKEKVKDIFKVVSGRGVMLNINDKELKIN
ncbi:MAG: DEAD/DEAH box helicase [Candidatus Caldatribacteriota bacterium]|nr:DEAD/DEAH box helicase [Candidatus Caldatribacteriota bacterium]